MPSGYKGKKIYTCLNCGNVKDWNWSSTNKYCDHNCQWDHKWKTVSLPKILEGKMSSRTMKAAVVKFLTDRDGYKCSDPRCKITEWFGETMILDIDHIDGDNTNEHPSNWRFLCPNCHRMTPTWGNKKR
jgi:hypothetical protein